MKEPLLAVILLVAFADFCAAEEWTPIPVPGAWETAANGRFAAYDGIAWYRCQVQVPEAWQDEDVYLLVEQVDNAYEVWVNGTKLGGGGSFPPNYRNGLDHKGRFPLDDKSLRPGQRAQVVVRVYDHDGKGGFKGPAPSLVAARDAIVLKGDWQFRTGDDLAWARGADLPADAAVFRKLVPITELSPTSTGESSRPLPPDESLRTMQVPDDLAVDLVLSEPIVAQPVFLTFDERGRMWVVQYRQYPHPAGLKMVSRDQYWRAVYDKVPLPPPRGERGRDRITIHEDADGDETFERHKTFVDGLNIATACAPGRGGVWVLNPPYLLFYPDANRDDVPDSDPVVHLEGFGLEDTHSVVNSLCWGPDGWLYAAQGSTVSGNVRRPGDKTAVTSQGQLIWRYHPETKRYEIFAEGGGNAFGVEIDAQGRIFSGHNGGDTRGFHYQQGAYLQKGFSKHGPLSNPFAFGYFPPMPHHTVPRFTHTYVIYDGVHRDGSPALPEKYNGKLFGVAPLLNHVVMSDVIPQGSTFRTQDVGLAIQSSDPWFRPVDIKIGPEGALYVADWYDSQANHYRNHEGQIDATNGRVYRLRARDGGTRSQRGQPTDFANRSTAELLERITNPGAQRWERRTSLQVLGDRRDGTATPQLTVRLFGETGRAALGALWALNLSGGFDDELAMRSLDHADPFVRLWTVRLICDDREMSTDLAGRLARLAREETNVEVRAQLACSAKRLPAKDGLAIVRGLLTHDKDAKDPRMPLLDWWAIEVHCDADRDAVREMFDDSTIWSLPLVAEHILNRLMRRYAAAGTRRDLLQCALYLKLAPTAEAAAALVRGFEEAYQGRSMGQLPDELLAALAERGGGSELLGVRLGRPEAVAAALRAVADSKSDLAKRIDFIQVLGDVRPEGAQSALLSLLRTESDADLLSATLTSLSGWSDPEIATAILARFADLPPAAQSVAVAVLVSRKTWSASLLKTVDAGRLRASDVPLDVVRRMTVHRDETIAALIAKHWGEVAGATTEQMQHEIERLKRVALDGSGSPYAGKKLFLETCGKCHRLHGQGGQIGPDLTTYKRDDLNTMLLSIVNPSAEIREGFESWLAADKDGRVLTGFLVDQDPKTIVLRGAEGQTVTIPRDNLDEFTPQRKSLMPEGLLSKSRDQDIRDLLAYLRSTQPLND